MSRDWDIVDDASDAGDPPEPTGLDERRIRLIAAERRAENRSRIRARLLVPTAAAMAIAATARAVLSWPASPRFAIACAVVAILAGVMALRAGRGARSRLLLPVDGPAVPPDFEALGGGEGDAAARLRRLDDDGRA